ncbi:zinc alcohol dehydrogenase [Colletotrichum kahawae]|uniref:Zinc alcohol dehydrogenase n=1 Tax=Colletotrichum kahawae TaxID=34407 RepID=A0AAD9YSX7_COLKA|nr:zinc alcohol dehydrogenase [Colletotrichum kahawae]
MATSRAWTLTARGAPRSVLSLTSRPVPTLPPAAAVVSKSKDSSEWLLIKVSYAALNPGGHFFVSMLPAAARAKTAVPEMDLGGVVADVWTPSSSSSASVARFRKGDRVAAFIPVSFGWATGTGALAEHVVLPAKDAVAGPGGVGLKEAGGVLTAGCTALTTVRAAGLKRGGRVLVNGASGGVGSLAVQMARDAVGPEGVVVAVCSGRNAEMVKRLGADEVVDYTATGRVSEALRERFGEEKQRFDGVVDCIGVQDVYASCAAYVVPGGVYAAVGIKPAAQTWGSFFRAVWTMQMNAVWPLAGWLGGAGRVWKGTTMMDPGRTLMEDVVGMLAEGRLKAVFDREVAMEEVVESGRARGKVVVKVGKE